MSSVYGSVRGCRRLGDLMPRLWSARKAHFGLMLDLGVSSQFQQCPGLLAPRAVACGWRGAEGRIRWAATAYPCSAAAEGRFSEEKCSARCCCALCTTCWLLCRRLKLRSNSAPSTSPRKSILCCAAEYQQAMAAHMTRASAPRQPPANARGASRPGRCCNWDDTHGLCTNPKCAFLQ